MYMYTYLRRLFSVGRIMCVCLYEDWSPVVRWSLYHMMLYSIVSASCVGVGVGEVSPFQGVVSTDIDSDTVRQRNQI